jgi:hypothetical protein
VRQEQHAELLQETLQREQRSGATAGNGRAIFLCVNGRKRKVFPNASQSHSAASIPTAL